MKDNKLIAEFMGLVYAPPSKRWDDWFTEDGTRVTFGSRIPLLYHSSWDWLMPVLEKVANYIEDNIEPEKLTMDKTGYNGYLKSYDIKVQYNAVVEFIKFYNQNK
tara:strand:+ start:2863 stop:3177 length:315 start_codon:yes stop_codon:yes gene_type:complete